MSKKQKVTFDELTERERLVLCTIADAVKRKDKYITVHIGKREAEVSIHPWDTERTGHWVEEECKTNPSLNRYKCSECGRFFLNDWAYCPGCGARMEVRLNAQTD